MERERESPRHQQGNFLLVLVIVFTFSSTFTPLDWVRPPQEKCHEIKIKVKETYDCVKAPPHHTTLYCIIITTLYTVYIGRWAPSIFILLLCLVDLSCFLCHVREARSMFFGSLFFFFIYTYSLPPLTAKYILVFLSSTRSCVLELSARFQDGHKLYIYFMYHIYTLSSPSILYFHAFQIGFTDQWIIPLVSYCLLLSFSFQYFVTFFFLNLFLSFFAAQNWICLF